MRSNNLARVPPGHCFLVIRYVDLAHFVSTILVQKKKKKRKRSGDCLHTWVVLTMWSEEMISS